MSSATRTTIRRKEPLSVWELPKLLKSVHSYRKSQPACPKERPHYPAILGFVYRNRFAVASQIQRRFKEQLPSDRTARRHLAEMEALGLLDVVPTNNTSPLWPKVYAVSRRGQRRLSEAYRERGREWQPSTADRRRAGYSSAHVLHELFTTELMLLVWEEAQRRPDWQLPLMERRSIATDPAFRVVVGGRQSRLEPDGVLVLRRPDEAMCYFLEVDNGTMSMRQIEEKFRRYEVWASSHAAEQYLTALAARHGRSHDRLSYRMLVVVHGETAEVQQSRCDKIRAAAVTYPEIVRNLTSCPVSDLQSLGIASIVA